jgi:5-deoxy-D-glucuronate isomerase
VLIDLRLVQLSARECETVQSDARDGAVVEITSGPHPHPVVAAPGYSLYYLWVQE